MPDVVLVDCDNGVAIVTLNRPESINALDSELMDRLPVVLRDLAQDPVVGCVVLTGAGRGFCSGGDLKARQAELDALAELPDDVRQRVTAPYRVDMLLRVRAESSRLLTRCPSRPSP